MTQQVKTLAAKLGNLSSIPGIHVVESRNRLLIKFSSNVCTCTHIHMCNWHQGGQLKST